MLKRIVKAFKNTILCLKYPFLYPRNRFTDEHYTNRIINNKIYNLRRKYLLSMSVGLITDAEFSEEIQKVNNQEEGKYPIIEISKSMSYSGRDLSLWRDGRYMFIGIEHNNRTNYNEFDINDYLNRTTLTDNDIEGVFFKNRITKTLMGDMTQSPYIVFVLKNGAEKKVTCPSFNFVKVDLLGYTKAYIVLLEYINKFLGIFHILPSYTELDAMEEGWRKCFGEGMCKEIRNSLILTYIKNENPTTLFGKVKAYYKGLKLLFSYRILQIKEKYGSLRWYSNGDTAETMEIISKYETLSMKTCIICGKDASFRSVGWICPYCEEHKPDNAVKVKGDGGWYDEI